MGNFGCICVIDDDEERKDLFLDYKRRYEKRKFFLREGNSIENKSLNHKKAQF